MRFDKNYAIGDKIPEDVIDPRRVQGLIAGGKMSLSIESQAHEMESTIVTAVTVMLTELVELIEEAGEIAWDGEAPDLHTRVEMCKEAIRTEVLNFDENIVEEEPLVETASNTIEDPADPSVDDTVENGGNVEGFTCTVCNKNFKTERGLEQHMQTHKE